jgi:hypothetical protein
MKKIVRLNESELKALIKESVKRILSEEEMIGNSIPMDDNGFNGEDPMAGGPDDMGGAPDDMGEGPEDMGGGNGHDELMQVADQLDTEDEAALIKYGKSMVDDSAAGGDDGGMMPESRFSFSRIISETLGSLLDKKDNDGIERPGKKLNSKLRGKKGNPFVSPY